MPIKLNETIANKPAILGVGPGGTGKSTFFGRFRRPFFVNADINMEGPKLQYAREGRTPDITFDYIHVDDNNKPVEFKQRYNRFAEVVERACKDPNTDTIIIDSITKMNLIFQAEVIRQANKKEGTPLAIQDWGVYLYLWNKVVDIVRSYNKTSVWIGHVWEDKNEIDQTMRLMLAMPGQTGTLLPISMTDMWRFSLDPSTGTDANGVPKKDYNIRTVQDERFINIKTSLDLPAKFPATQEWADKIDKLIYRQ